MEKADIIIFGGQSNMKGQTGCFPEVNDIVNGAFDYRSIENVYVPLKLPVGEEIGGNLNLLESSRGSGSLVPHFCREYIAATGKKVLAIHVAKGNTTVEDWQKGTYRYQAASKKIRQGIEKARELYDIEHIYYVWLQGESDALVESTEDEYLERLTRYKNTLKKELDIEKFGIIKVGYFYCTSQWHKNVSTYEIKKAYDEAVMSAQERAAAEDSDFLMLTRVCPELSMMPEYINPEASGHYTNAAMEIIGKSAGRALAEI